jgi:uncharacterized cofD-like protein
VVVFGGGTGLSNVIGGDSRREEWTTNPFCGLKQLFPKLTSVVCVTDDGGSTGELLKDLPLVALGDLRHVLLSSVRQNLLCERYGLSSKEALNLAISLHAIFNYRFDQPPETITTLCEKSGIRKEKLPQPLYECLVELVHNLFTWDNLNVTLQRSHCLGNLLIAAAILHDIGDVKQPCRLEANHQSLRTAMIRGLEHIARAIGVLPHGVLPCTTTPAQLQFVYANGVLVTSESKSERADRGYPVDRVFVKYHRPPFTPPEVVEAIRRADILIFAPGSLYTSIIPIFQAKELVEEVRSSKALKLLVANLWVQKGETDTAKDEPNRKFHVSDLLKAYELNIPGGVTNLFSHVLTLDLGDISGTVLQNYAIENKIPIYLDREKVEELGFTAVKAGIYDSRQLQHRKVIQHDPDGVALAVRTLLNLHIHGLLPSNPARIKRPKSERDLGNYTHSLLPCRRYREITLALDHAVIEHVADTPGRGGPLAPRERRQLLERVIQIIWQHHDIIPDHLRFILGVTLVDPIHWQRSQKWDNVFSFYDPHDKHIKIRSDQVENPLRFEMAFLVALGQSLLGNYAYGKKIEPVQHQGEDVGRIFTLLLREKHDLHSYFSLEELDCYLRAVRMRPADGQKGVYTRLVHGNEGFTPPGLLFGLFFTWYLDNRFAPNIEYKMSIMRNEISNLIPEQVKIYSRRKELIIFFRETVFGYKELVKPSQTPGR